MILELSWLEHFLQGLSSLLIVLGPLPLAIAWVDRWSDPAMATSHTRAERWLATTVLAIALQIGVGILLGVIGRFAIGPLLAFELALLAAGALLVRRADLAPWRPVLPRSESEAAVAMVVVIAGALAFWDLLQHPTRNFDSLAYHLPVMARWVAAGRLEVFEGIGQVALYPSHWELLTSLWVLPLREDFLVSAANMLAWAQLGLAVRALGERLGASAASSSLSAGLVLLIPSVLSRLDAIQPDIALAAVFATALVFLLRPVGAGRSLDLAIVLLCAGLMPGLKLSGPIFILFLLVASLLRTPGSWRRPRDIAQAWAWSWAPASARVWIPVGVFALVLAGYWYLRNAVVLGNPLGDLELRVLGIPLIEGTITRAELSRGALAHVFRIGSAEDWKVLWGVLRTWMSIPAGILALMAASALLRRSAEPSERRAQWIVAGLMLACTLLYWNTPYSGDNGTHDWRVTPWIQVGLRYGFPGLAMLGALAARGFDRGRFTRAVFVAAFAMSAAWASLLELNPPLLLVAALSLIALVLCTMLLPAGARLRHPVPVVVLALALMIGGWSFAHPLRMQREHHRALVYGKVFETLEESVGPYATIGVINTRNLYPASGRAWSRRVVVPALPARDDEAAWVASLKRDGITVLMFGHDNPRPEEADRVVLVSSWLRREGGNFELLHDYETQRKNLALFRLRGRR